MCNDVEREYWVLTSGYLYRKYVEEKVEASKRRRGRRKRKLSLATYCRENRDLIDRERDAYGDDAPIRKVVDDLMTGKRALSDAQLRARGESDTVPVTVTPDQKESDG
jgi:hypothetical protein